MKSFVDKTIKPFLIIAGLLTSSAGLTAFLPKFSMENVLQLPFSENYTIIIQHWGMAVLLVGIFLIIAAFKVSWRIPVLTYTVVEKAFFVFLCLQNIQQPFFAGFRGAVVMDSIIVIYLLLFFWTRRNEKG